MAYTLYFNKEDILVTPDKKTCIFPSDQNEGSVLLGQWNQKPLFAAHSNKKGSFVTVREALDLFDPQTLHMICRGKHLLHWHSNSKFSGCCGKVTHFDPKETAKQCSACKQLIFPPTHPVIMVLIEKGDTILLAQHKYGPSKMYSTLAGFVDPGESLEEAVRREVKEEVNLTIKDISYLGSQSWPFPTSLIMAFKATYDSGEITIDPEELTEADWYKRDNLPPLPPKISLSRHIIDQWIRS